MSGVLVFRCDHYGDYADIDQAETYWTPIDDLGDGRTLGLVAAYCSPYCGRTASARAGTVRG